MAVLASCSDSGFSSLTPEPPGGEDTRLLQATPGSVSLVDLQPLQEGSATVVWTSVGEAAVTVSGASIEGQGWTMETLLLPVDLAPGTSLVSTLGFASGTEGTWTGSFTLQAETDAGSSLSVPLSAFVLGDTGLDTGDTGDTGGGDDTGDPVHDVCGEVAPFRLEETGRISVPGTAQIAIDAERRRLFVPYEYGGEEVGVYDIDTLDLLEELAAESMPNPVLVNDLGGYVLVGNKMSSTVSVYEADSLAPVSTLDIHDPQHFVLDRDLGRVLVASLDGGEVSVLGAHSMSEIGTIPLDWGLRQGQYADGFAVYPSTSGHLHVIDAKSLSKVADIELGEQLFSAAWVPEADRIYASGWDSGTVYAIEASSRTTVTTLPVRAPYQMATDLDRCLVAVAGYGDDRLHIIDASTDTVLVDSMVCSSPMDVVQDPATRRWFVACYGSDEIVVLTEADR